MPRISIQNLQSSKNKNKITCLTAYTFSIAKIIDKYVDIILVGDSVGTTLYGMKNTQSVDLNMMINHGKAVCNASKKAFTIVDMPYNTYRNNKEALTNAKKLIKHTKCKSIKLETDRKTINIVKHLTKNEIKVISHIGVTPQKYKDLKKIRVIGNTIKEKSQILNLAIQLEKAGSSMIVLECMKEDLAKTITQKLKIPTIGIGASLACDGQVLVINDILNLNNFQKTPRFIKSYTNLSNIIEKAVKKYSYDVRNKIFPKIKNTY